MGEDGAKNQPLFSLVQWCGDADDGKCDADCNSLSRSSSLSHTHTRFITNKGNV